MNVDDIDTYPLGAVVNFQRSNGSVVSTRILAPQSVVPTTGPPHAILYFTRDVLEAKCLYFFCRALLQGVFSSKRALPEVPLQPNFCHCIVLSSSGSHEAPCSPGDKCITKTEICVSVTLGCVYHVCIPTFKSVYHMCVPPFSHSGVRFLRSYLDIILS